VREPQTKRPFMRLGRGWIFYSTYLGAEANEAVSEAGEVVGVQEFSSKNL
jgi:hypothetical protein